MGKKKGEPTDWDSLQDKFQSNDGLPEPECILPANHREMMKDEKPRAERGPKKDTADEWLEENTFVLDSATSEFLKNLKPEDFGCILPPRDYFKDWDDEVYKRFEVLWEEAKENTK